jgi:hypothetical protein
MCVEKGGFDHVVKASEKCESLKNLVLLDDIEESKVNAAREKGLTIYTY